MYGILGIDKSASQDDIKKAYRKLALIHHPDKPTGDAVTFQKIQTAYETLSDPQKRQEHDSPPLMFNPQDIFSQMFNRPPEKVKKPNHNHDVVISLEESYRGISKKIRVGVTKHCFECRTVCHQCGGRGVIHIQMGPVTINHPCPGCNGREPLAKGCATCKFKIDRVEYVDLQINLQIGIYDGHTICLEHLGEQPYKPDEIPGDLIFTVKVKAHPDFIRSGNDLLWSKAISFSDSVLGTLVKIPHFDGDMMISTGDWGVINPTKEYIIKDKGFPGGSLRITFDIRYPDPSVKFDLILIDGSD